MSTLETNKIRPISGSTNLTIGDSGDTVTLTSGAKTSGFGKIGQVKQTVKLTTGSVSGTSYSDLPDMSVSITPSSTTSKILIMFSLNFGTSVGDIHVRLLRGTTAIGQPNNGGGYANNDCHTSAGSSRNQYEMSNVSSTYLDSPATTSATTYKLQAVSRPDSTGNTLYINRTVNDASGDNGERTASTITVMEILD